MIVCCGRPGGGSEREAAIERRDVFGRAIRTTIIATARKQGRDVLDAFLALAAPSPFRPPQLAHSL